MRSHGMAFVMVLLAGCSRPSPPASQSSAPPVFPQAIAPTDNPSAVSKFPERLTAAHLPNPVRVHERVISGGLPEGDEAFAELAALGVKTVISVDGARPDVVTAERHGMRYVHLPHGYDGIPEDRARALAKAVHDLPGQIYIHCHHGKHRSPAAAAVACVQAGLIEPDGARAVLELAGTSPNYRGLYESAEQARPLGEEAIAALDIKFAASVPVPPMAEAMVAIEHTHDRMKQVAAAGWRSPPDHPDVDPAHEALLLREHFTELLRNDDVQARSAAFRDLVVSAEQDGLQLEAGLRAQPPDTAAAGAALDRITANCSACHKQFRDVPLDEK